MIRTDLHVHTDFCDGSASPEEMVLSAISLGMECIGFSVHSYTAFDEEYCIAKERIGEYRDRIGFLQKKYTGRIRILCGVEKDYYSDMPTDGFDYIIGSVHYIRKNGSYIPMDESGEILLHAAESEYGGDLLALAEDYYRILADVVEKTGADVIGHFDVISKYNKNSRLFDETHPRYVAAYTASLDRLLKYEKPFELNTGGIARTGKTEPYPNLAILRLICEKGGRILLSSDSHCPGTLCFQFDQWESAAKKIGFKPEDLQKTVQSIIAKA